MTKPTSSRHWATASLVLGAFAASLSMSVGLAEPQSKVQDTAYAKDYLKLEFEQARKLANRGAVEAQFQVGRSYQMGVGVEQDFKRSQRWLRTAAVAGSMDAVVAEGQSFEFGWGVPVNISRAFEHYNRAAEQRSIRAFDALGHLYLKGGGSIKPDAREAFKWFSLAAAHGHYRSPDDKRDVAQKMTPVSLEYAGYRANRWERHQQGREEIVVAQREEHVQSTYSRPYRYKLVDVYSLVDVYQLANRARQKAGQ